MAASIISTEARVRCRLVCVRYARLEARQRTKDVEGGGTTPRPFFLPLYQVRIDRFAFSCRLRPPVVAGVRAYELALVQQSYATIHERLLQILDLLEVAVCYPFVAQRPQPF